MVAEVIRERLSDVSIVKLLDGAVIFETECSYDRLNFFCFNNIFAVIDLLETNDKSPLELHIRKISSSGRTHGAEGLLSERARSVISENNKKIQTFRLVCSMENTPVSVNEKLRQDIENFITRSSALRVDRTNADTEFWFLYRREGFSLFMKRLTRHAAKEKTLHPGELAPQLAWLLCRIAGLKAGESAADPFCGYGSIPEAAVKHFPIAKFFASDIDPRCVKISASRPALKTANGRCEIRCSDVFTVQDFLPGNGLNAIITDPPWGMFKETGLPLGRFYEETLAVFSRLLKKGGRAVILTAARREIEAAAEKTPALAVTRIIPVLVSGKKAAVYIMELL